MGGELIKRIAPKLVWGVDHVSTAIVLAEDASAIRGKSMKLDQ